MAVLAGYHKHFLNIAGEGVVACNNLRLSILGRNLPFTRHSLSCFVTSLQVMKLRV